MIESQIQSNQWGTFSVICRHRNFHFPKIRAPANTSEAFWVSTSRVNARFIEIKWINSQTTYFGKGQQQIVVASNQRINRLSKSQHLG